MVIIKDLILVILFLCMFGVLLCFAQFQHELRSSAIQNDITINAQVRIIQSSFEAALEQMHKINGLKVDVMDLREVLLVLQKNEEMSEHEIKELKTENKRLERNKRDLLYKIEKLEKEIKDEM